jgi:hypothetical protein
MEGIMARDKRTNTQRAAAAALGVGAESLVYTPEKFVAELTETYDHYVRMAKDAVSDGRAVRGRVHYGMAYTAALILTDYYQAQGDTEHYNLWSDRRDQAQTRALKRSNKLAEAIGAISYPRPEEFDDE